MKTWSDNRITLDFQGFPGLSLLYHKGIHLLPEQSKLAWTYGHFQRYWGIRKFHLQCSYMFTPTWRPRKRKWRRWTHSYEVYDPPIRKCAVRNRVPHICYLPLKASHYFTLLALSHGLPDVLWTNVKLSILVHIQFACFLNIRYNIE